MAVQQGLPPRSGEGRFARYSILRKLVVVAGMPRGGTTSLYQISTRHPGCFVPFRKETAYFSFNHYKGERWYKGLYSERPDAMPGLDISPQYFVDLRSSIAFRRLRLTQRSSCSYADPVDWIISSFFPDQQVRAKAQLHGVRRPLHDYGSARDAALLTRRRLRGARHRSFPRSLRRESVALPLRDVPRRAGDGPQRDRAVRQP